MAEQIGLQAVLDIDNFLRGVGQYQGAIDDMEGKTKGFVGAAVGHFQDFGAGVLKATAIVGGAVVAAGAAIGAFVAKGISDAAELESRMSGIAAVLNLTTKEAEPLKKLIQDLAINPNLKVDSDGAADAIENLAKNGATANQIIGGLAENTILLANATGAQFGPAADVVTSVMAQFNKTAEQSTEIVNGVVGVTNASKLSFDDYRLAVGQAGGVTASYGVTLEDFNAVLAATAPLANSGSDAGTSMKSFYNSLIPTTKANIKAFKELGLNFYDTNGKMKSGAEIAELLNEKLFQEVKFTKIASNETDANAKKRKMLESVIASTNMELYKYQVGINGVAQSEKDKEVSIDRLNRKHDAAIKEYEALAGSMGTTITYTKKLTDEERNRFINQAFGVDGSRVAIAMAKAGAVAYTDAAVAARELGVSQDEVNKYIKDGITGFEVYQIQIGKANALEQAKVRNDNFKASLEILTDTISAVQLMIGDAFLPILRQLTIWATDWVNTNSPPIIEAFKQFAEQLNAVVQWIGIVVSDGDIMNDWLTHMSPNVQAVVLGLVDFVAQTQAFIAAAQATIGPIIAVVSQFVSWKDVLITVGLAVASVVIPAIWGFIAALVPVIATVGAVILAVAALRNAWESDFLGIQTGTIAAINYITGALAPFTSSVAEHFRGALTEIKNFALGNQTEFTNVAAIWEGAKTSATTLFTDLSSLVTTYLPIWIATLTTWGNAASQWITDAIPVVTQRMTEWYTAIATYITTNYPTWLAGMALWGTALWQWIVDAAALGIVQLGAWYTALSTYITGQLPTWIAAMALWSNTLWQWIVDASALAVTQLGVWFVALSSYIVSMLPALKNSLVEYANTLWQWILDASTQTPAHIDTWFSSLISRTKEQLPTWKTQFVEWSTAMWQWILDAVEKTAPGIEKWFSALLSTVGGKLVTFTREMLKWATALVSWVSSSEADALPALGTWLGKVLGWAALGAVALVAKMLEWAFALTGWIAKAIVQLSPELGNFQAALLSGMANVSVALLEMVANMGIEMAKTIYGAANWKDIGQNIISDIRDGLASMESALINKAKEILQSLKDLWKNALSYFKDIGKNIIQGIIDGAGEMGSALTEYFSTLISDLIQRVKEGLGIASPSKVFMAIGRNVVQGFMDGIRNEWEINRSILGDLFLFAIPKSSIGGTGYWDLPSGLSKAKDVASGLLNVFKKLADMSPSANHSGMSAAVQGINDSLTTQLDLLDQIEKAGLDPRGVLGDTWMGIGADPGKLADSIFEVTKLAQQKLNNEVINRRNSLISKFVLQPFTDALTNQAKVITDTLKGVATDFGKIRIDRILSQIADVDKQIANLTQISNQSGLNPEERKRFVDLVNQRGTLAAQIGATGNIEGLFNISSEATRLEQMKKQVDLLKQARDLSADIPADAFGNIANDSTLRALIEVYGHVQNAQLNQLQSQLSSLQSNNIQAQLNQYKAQQAALDSQIALLQKAKDLDLQLPNGSSVSDMNSLSLNIAQEQLRRTQNELAIIRGIPANLLNLSPTNSVAQLYKSQVLDPMLKTLREAVLLDSERADLMAKYVAGAEKVQALNDKQGQLDYLKFQADLVKQVNDTFSAAGAKTVLADTHFGLDASLDDLLAFAGRMVNGMVNKVKHGLGIASPSKVFIDIGQRVMQGFSRGMESMSDKPIMAINQALRPLPYAYAGGQRTMNVNMGGVSISNGMDDVMFEHRVRQVVEGLLG